MRPLHVYSFPARDIDHGADAHALFARVADGLRELLPIASMTRYVGPAAAAHGVAVTAAPNEGDCDALERQRKRDTERVRAAGHFGRAAGALASGVRVFENDDPDNHYARLFVHGERPVAQQYLGALIAIAGDTVRAPLSAAWTALLGEGFDGRIRNINYCPPQGFIPWHTNRYDAAGWRLYLVDVPAGEDGASQFCISGGDSVRRIPDRAGWFNLFYIGDDRPLWHCVGSESRRVSCGVRLTDATAARLLARARAAGSVEEWGVA